MSDDYVSDSCHHLQCLGVSDYWKNLREGRKGLEMELSAMEWMMLMMFTCNHGQEL